MSFLKMLDRPPREYTPVPFWFLNGDLSHEEIRRQLRDFCDHGVYGAVLHPRMGLREDIGYLSESFFGYMRTAIETAAELDMRIVLYDEGMYPSGSAGGLVVRDRPDLASRELPGCGNSVTGIRCCTKRTACIWRSAGASVLSGASTTERTTGNPARHSVRIS